MAYRDDRPALEARAEDLRAELRDLTRKAEALADVAREKEAAARALADVEARLSRMAATRLPLLESVRVASPCSASWDEMVGDDRTRFCPSCEKNVYNLSTMASADAERLLAEHEGSICVRLYRRVDGTVMTTDCPVGVRRKRVKRAVVAVAGAGAMAAAAAGLFLEKHEVMGEMAAPGWAGGAAVIATPALPVDVSIPFMGDTAPPAETGKIAPVMGPAPDPLPPGRSVVRPHPVQGRAVPMKR